MRVIFIFKDLKKKNGGCISALELANSLFEIGMNINIYLSKPHKESTAIYDVFTGLPDNRIWKLPPEVIYYHNSSPLASRFEQKNRKPGLRTKLSSLIHYPYSLFKKHFKNANLIIYVNGLNHAQVSGLRRYTEAPIIYNHPVNPDHEMSYMLLNFKNKFKKSEPLDCYKDICKMYDGLLFQAHEHLNRACELEAVEKEQGFILKPSTEEAEVKNAMNSMSPFEKNTCNLVVVGTVCPWKRQDQSIKAFSELCKVDHRAIMHIIGGGIARPHKEYYIKLKELVKTLNIEHRVVFHGHKLRNECLQLMAHADLLVQTSEYEGVSRVLREAMFLKLPILSYEIPGTREILKKNEDAILVEPGNVEQLANAMKELAQNPELRKNLAECAFQKYGMNHSKAVYTSNALDMVRFFATKKKNPSSKSSATS